jgi:hypothetical protein
LTDITEVRSVYPDQRPVLFQMLLPSSPYAAIAGVGGLLAVFETSCALPSANSRGNPSATQLHTLSNNIQQLFYGNHKGIHPNNRVVTFVLSLDMHESFM